ncbi:SGNH/GDSL hydrolase family protein [Prauserella rugosa]|uniref:Lysophospholipase L1-like esterase n=1 Tax=Prauserella rugosa TaxID=43354 RepID=A0A660C7L8_9PSEU|nr:SGNH/GDSL hydrolase family protein [Prauserella rugosa]KID31512.1 lysophospholipase L1-like esterase [Prauserella sp. Am3]KMS86819.1 SGNH hydrolase [Streptomyces regensis]TWH19336.1 lysophospholipase L1-like esterase [Prauserella rugosa]
MIQRFVALGDSFTEGVGDDDPAYPNGVRGWADRVAEALAAADPSVTYANLAVRGRLLDRIVAEQIDPALTMRPDLVTLYAGGNDLMRPRPDIDRLAETYDVAVGKLAASGATVVLFTGVDGIEDPVFRKMRGRTAVYNEHVRLIAARHGALVVDMWAMRALRDRRMWSADRIHLGPDGHTTVAKAVLDTLGVPHRVPPVELGPPPATTAAQRRAENLHWARTHVVPWIGRRLRGTSSGDAVTAKRPEPAPVVSRP